MRAKPINTSGVDFIAWKLEFEHKVKFISKHNSKSEFKPIKGRLFRVDFYLPEYNCVIEYEGINSRKSGHLTFSGYTKDCEKYNLISLEGYIILRFTMKNLCYFDATITKLISNHKPKQKGRKKGSKQLISKENVNLANEIREFIKENNIPLSLIRSKLDMTNSSIYYFMQGRTHLESWLPIIEEILTLCCGFKRNVNDLSTTNHNDQN